MSLTTDMFERVDRGSAHRVGRSVPDRTAGGPLGDGTSRPSRRLRNAVAALLLGIRGEGDLAGTVHWFWAWRQDRLNLTSEVVGNSRSQTSAPPAYQCGGCVRSIWQTIDSPTGSRPVSCR